MDRWIDRYLASPRLFTPYPNEYSIDSPHNALLGQDEALVDTNLVRQIRCIDRKIDGWIEMYR